MWSKRPNYKSIEDIEGWHRDSDLGDGDSVSQYHRISQVGQDLGDDFIVSEFPNLRPILIILQVGIWCHLGQLPKLLFLLAWRNTMSALLARVQGPSNVHIPKKGGEMLFHSATHPRPGTSAITLYHKSYQVYGQSSDIWYLLNSVDICRYLMIFVDLWSHEASWRGQSQAGTELHSAAVGRTCEVATLHGRWAIWKKSTGIYRDYHWSNHTKCEWNIDHQRLVFVLFVLLCWKPLQSKLLSQVCWDLVVAASTEFLALPWPWSNIYVARSKQANATANSESPPLESILKAIFRMSQDGSEMIWIASKTMAACDRLLSAPSGGALWSEDSKYLSNMRCMNMYDIFMTYLCSEANHGKSMIAVIAPFTSHSLCCKDRSCAWAAALSVLPPSRSSGVILRPSSSTSSKRKSRKSHLRFRANNWSSTFSMCFFCRSCQVYELVGMTWEESSPSGRSAGLLVSCSCSTWVARLQTNESALKRPSLRTPCGLARATCIQASPIIPSNANKIQQESRNITKSMWLCRLCACLGVEQKDRRKPGHFTWSILIHIQYIYIYIYM